MSKKKEQLDVLELEAEDMGNGALEKQIENALVKENITDKVIASLKEKYGDLRLRNVEDKEMYLEIISGRKDVRKIGILVERICEAGRSDAIKIQRLWLSKQKEVLSKIAEIQDPLDAEIKKFDDNVERIENEERQRKENVYMQRQSLLIKYGANYMDGSFVLNHISYEATIVKEADIDIWEETILPKYKREYEKNEASRVAEEKRREEEAEKFRLEQQEMKRQREEFEQQQAEFKKAQEELSNQRIESERKEQQRLAEEQRLKAEVENKRWRDRLSQIDEVGWNGQFAFPRLGNEETKIFTYDELVHLPDDVFNTRLKKANDETAEIKKAIQERREAQIAEQTRLAEESAAKRERERIEEATRQEEIRKEQAEQQRIMKLEQASDKDKWGYLVVQINGIDIPEMKSRLYKQKIQRVMEMIAEISEL